MNRYIQEIVANWNELESKKLNKHISVDWGHLARIAEKLALDNFDMPDWRVRGIYAEHEWAFAAQLLFANCLNAHYNVFEKPDTKYTVANPADPAKLLTGAFAMSSVIFHNFYERIPHADDFRKYVKSKETMAKFFGGIVPIPSPELKQECGFWFAEHLSGYKYYGNPLNVIEEAMVYDADCGRRVLLAFNNGNGLVEILANDFGIAYADSQYLTSETGAKYLSHFLKRAQLVAVMLHDRAMASDGVLPPVADIDEVGPIADYEIPKALRHLRILKYSKELAELVDNWKEVQRDSQMEVEIRMATVAACAKLLEKINSLKLAIAEEHAKTKLAHLWSISRPINICHLDYWLWKMGRDARHLRPHLTRTSAY